MDSYSKKNTNPSNSKKIIVENRNKRSIFAYFKRDKK
jgi:hypothetical protein